MLITIFYIFLFLFLCFLIIFLVFSFGAYFLGAPFVPSDPKTIDKTLDIAEVKEGTVFCDLGSGDGRVLIAATRKGALSIGYELNPFWLLVAQIRIWLLGLQKKISLRRENFMSPDPTTGKSSRFQEVDVFYIYLFPEKVAELEEIMKQKVKKGARIITYKFPFPNWKEKEFFEAEKLYLYVK